MESGRESDDDLQTGSKISLPEEKSVVLENIEIYSDDADDAERASEDEVSPDETLIERLDLLRPNNPYRELDKRSHVVRQKIKKKFKDAPKTVIEQAEDEKSVIEKRLEQIDKEMADLLAYGNEIISNIKVANEKRERLRREFEEEMRTELESRINKESNKANADYNEIVARWSELGELQEPLVLFEKLNGQKNNVMKLLRSKEEMIAKCQQEIDRMDQSFEQEQLKQQTDIRTMVERANAQIGLLKQAYSHRFNLLEDTLASERQTIALKEHEKWKQFYDTAQANEKYKLEIAKEKKSFYSNEIQRITTQQEQITRSTRIRLEKESEMLLHELRCTRTNMLTNSEKLDYNYQVLQKRNEENVVINNQQKRRVGKLSETIVEIKKRIISAQASAESAISKSSSEIQKLHDSITELEEKNERFQLHNRKKFLAVWDVNFQEVKTVIERVFYIDRLLHEQQLGLPWQDPNLDLEEFELVKQEKALLHVGDSQSHASGISDCSDNIKAKNEFAKSASISLGKPLNQDIRKRQRDTLIRRAEEERKKQEQRIEKRLLRNILRKVADQGGFLVEDRLLQFLEPYTEQQKTLVRIDNIFAALRITDMAAVNRLVEYFKPFAWCPNCMKGTPIEQLKKLFRPCQLLKLSSNAYNEDEDLSHLDNINQSYVSAETDTVINKMTSYEYSSKVIAPLGIEDIKKAPVECENHYLTIETSMVLTALSEFANQGAKIFEEESKGNRTLHSSKAISTSHGTKFKQSVYSMEISDDAICEYWRKFQDYMPQEKLKLWHCLEHGLLHYLNVLKQREQLSKDCDALRRQNAELKHFLKKFNV